MAAENSPFQPGTGKLPPYLAGRKPEQALIRRFLNELAQRAAPAGDIILYGPRGNGKTALLEWSRREAEALKIQVADLLGGDLLTVEQLAAALSSGRRWLDALRGFTLGPVSVRLESLAPGPVSSALSRRTRKQPLVILIDEAHMLGVTPGRSLLGTVQAFRRVEVPVLLVLAGTPDLPRHLRAMGASFWIRNQRLRIGRLEPDTAAEAIRVPLEERGRSIEQEALQQVVAESHGYPFFLQLWGDMLWTECNDPSAPSSLVDIDRVRPLFQQRREDLYDELLEDLIDARLVSVAAAVAAEFTAAQQVPRERVAMAIEESLREKRRASDGGTVLDAERSLRHQGFIWPVVKHGIGYYEPGIPSLMRHVTLNERKNREVRGEAW